MRLTRTQWGVVVAGVIGFLWAIVTTFRPPNPIVHVKAGRRPVLEVVRELSTQIPSHSRILVEGRAAVEGDCVVSANEPQRARAVLEEVASSAGLRLRYIRFEPFYDPLRISLHAADALAAPRTAWITNGAVTIDGVRQAPAPP